MKILLIGGYGMLGTDLREEFVRRGWEVIAPTLEELDITDPVQVAGCAEMAGEWVVNAAAYTAVDKAESEPDEAMMVNGLAVGYLGQMAAMAGSKFLHISTDFVFDGTKTEPYTEDDATNPLGEYGRSKLVGEEQALAHAGVVVRTAWLFGPNGGSFPRTMIRVAREGKPLRVVADQTGCPTYTADLARVIADLIAKIAYPGVYHAVGPDTMTWHEFACRTLSAAGIDYEIAPISTAEYPTPAKRPAYSVLSSAKIEAMGIAPMRPIDEALAEFVSRLG
ncbi:MAG: dTDP-4-dehydrorhamnose reductase [Methanoregulaceae archaeon]|nr:dTDP-4-dehydrorhamnose reductase [Methanoregulaceae archaeon]